MAGQSLANPTTDEFIVRIEPDICIAEYRGTRTMLEAEVVFPEDFNWPAGYHDARWRDQKRYYWLSRRRPEGAKGPRKDFSDCDWWHLRIEPVGAKHFIQRRAEIMAKELAEYVHRNTPEGSRKLIEEYERHLAARKDSAFQAFKAACGIVEKKRGRRSKPTHSGEGQ